MHDFGKLTAYPKQIVIQPEVRDDKGTIIIPQRTTSILTLKDKDRIIAGFPSPLKEQAEIEWNYGTSFSRNSPLLKPIMQQLELSDEEVDTHWQRIARV